MFYILFVLSLINLTSVYIHTLLHTLYSSRFSLNLMEAIIYDNNAFC